MDSVISGIVSLVGTYMAYQGIVPKTQENHTPPVPPVEAATGKYALAVVQHAVSQGTEDQQQALLNFERNPSRNQGLLHHTIRELIDNNPMFLIELTSILSTAIAAGTTYSGLNIQQIVGNAPFIGVSMGTVIGTIQRYESQHRERQGEARHFYEEALRVCEQMLGDNHPQTARSMNNLAGVLSQQGQYGEARPLYERALVTNQAVLGAEHPETVTIMNNLAGVLSQQGQYGEAQRLYEQALAINQAVLGAEHPETVTIMNNLAFILEQQGLHGDALRWYEHTVRVQMAVLGFDHPETARSMHNLAFILERQGRYGDAQRLHERALAANQAVLGAEHPETARSMNNLAGVLVKQGQYGEAQRLYERTLATNQAVLGAEHPETATSIYALAGLFDIIGDYAAARSLYERALAIRQTTLGMSHPDTAESFYRLAIFLAKLKEYSTRESIQQLKVKAEVFWWSQYICSIPRMITHTFQGAPNIELFFAENIAHMEQYIIDLEILPDISIDESYINILGQYPSTTVRSIAAEVSIQGKRLHVIIDDPLLFLDPNQDYVDENIPSFEGKVTLFAIYYPIDQAD